MYLVYRLPMFSVLTVINDFPWVSIALELQIAVMKNSSRGCEVEANGAGSLIQCTGSTGEGSVFMMFLVWLYWFSFLLISVGWCFSSDCLFVYLFVLFTSELQLVVLCRIHPSGPSSKAHERKDIAALRAMAQHAKAIGQDMVVCLGTRSMYRGCVVIDVWWTHGLRILCGCGGPICCSCCIGRSWSRRGLKLCICEVSRM